MKERPEFIPPESSRLGIPLTTEIGHDNWGVVFALLGLFAVFLVLGVSMVLSPICTHQTGVF